MHRREFLAWSTGAAVGALSSSTLAAGATRQWQLAAEPGLFETDDVLSLADQMRFAAEHGIRAFVDAGWMMRPAHERMELAAVSRDLGITWGPFRGPRFSCAAGDRWEPSLHHAIEEAATLGISRVRIEVPAAGWCPCGDTLQKPRVCQPWVSSALVEPLVRDPAEYAKALQSFADHGAMLSVDLYHLAASGVNVPGWLDEFLPHVGHLEAADFPGGLEPGTGRLDYPHIIRLFDQHGYSGLVGLRHGRSQSGPAGIAAALRAWHALLDSSFTSGSVI